MSDGHIHKFGTNPLVTPVNAPDTSVVTAWVTVPVEPTDDMLRAAAHALHKASGGDLDAGSWELAPVLRAALAAAPQPAQAPDRMDELRRSVAEIIGCDPETWPEHGNAPLAIAAIVALGEKARERLYGKGQHGGSYRKPDGSLWKVITETDPDAPRKPAERPAQAPIPEQWRGVVD